MAPKVPIADLQIASDLQNQVKFPVRTSIDQLKAAAGAHFGELPPEAVQAAQSATVPENETVKRDTIGAANPLAIAAATLGTPPKVTDPALPGFLEKNFGANLETLLDPSKSAVIFPGLKLNPNGQVDSVSAAGGGPGGPGKGITWVDAGHFFTDAAQFTDPIQGDLADCYFIAALASVAWAGPLLIEERTIPMATDGSFGDSDAADVIAFFDSAGRHDIDATELLPQQNGQWIHARADDPTELWPGVYEKAFAKWKTDDASQEPNYSAINYGDTVAAAAALTGGAGSYYPTSVIITIPIINIKFDLVTPDQIWQTVRANSLSMRTVVPMMAWTYPSSAAAPTAIDYGSANIVANHAYSVLGWDYQNSTEYIILRNPWGWLEATVNVEGGDWSAYDISYWRQTPLSSVGVFGLRADTFKQYFQGFGKVTFPAGADPT